MLPQGETVNSRKLPRHHLLAAAILAGTPCADGLSTARVTIRLLGTMNDAELGRRLRRTHSSVASRRVALKIPPFKARPPTYCWAPCQMANWRRSCAAPGVLSENAAGNITCRPSSRKRS